MTDDDSKLSRRSFLELGGSVILLGGADAGVAPQLDTTDQLDVDTSDLDVYGLVLDTNRPSPDLVAENWDTYRLVHIDPSTGEKAYLTHLTSSWRDIPVPIPTTQIDDVPVTEFSSFFDHTFARPESPDEKNWVITTGGVTKNQSEVELDATAVLETNQHGSYPPGKEAIAGGALRLTGTPTAGEGRGGYYNDDDGFGVGEDADDSFVFLRKGGSEHQVYRSDWNGHTPNSRVWVNDQPVITRFPHLFYGGGSIEVNAILHTGNQSKVRKLHTFTPENTPGTWGVGPPFDQPNLPFRFETDSLSGGALRANAAHYERGMSDAEKRVNGAHFDGVSVPTNDWVPLLSWRKRTGWDMVNIQPLNVAVNAISNDIKLELQLDPTLSSATFSLPIHTSSPETAIEVTRQGNQGSISTDGERRWAGFAASGSGVSAGAATISELQFTLPNNQIVTLAAQAIGNNATAEGAVTWEEFY